MLRNSVVVSGNRTQPKVVWTIRPYSERELRRVIEADGMAPFEVLNILPLDRRGVSLAGAPKGCQYAYLVMVEVRALFASE